VLGPDSSGLGWARFGACCELGNEVCGFHTIHRIFPITALFPGVSWIDCDFEMLLDV
jgi:hypothetical protein